jgi:rhamnogalacturonan endolyase
LYHHFIEKIIFSDNFNNGYDTSVWKAEIAPEANSSVYPVKGTLMLDTKGGVTVWLNKLLTGNIVIEYKRKVLVRDGINDRLSDLNSFWMAADPRNANLFTRKGVLEEYDSLRLYYVGMGGNTNKTTRFRKYTGSGERRLIQEYTDSAHLLVANKEYTIRIIVKDGITQYLADDVVYFTFKDADPLTKGYFGFRSTKSRHEIDDVKVFTIK